MNAINQRDLIVYNGSLKKSPFVSYLRLGFDDTLNLMSEGG